MSPFGTGSSFGHSFIPCGQIGRSVHGLENDARLLGAGEAQGVKAGDEFALVQKNAAGADERIALVRVVRSGALGSSAVVIGQSLPNIAAGVTARRIARVP